MYTMWCITVRVKCVLNEVKRHFRQISVQLECDIPQCTVFWKTMLNKPTHNSLFSSLKKQNTENDFPVLWTSLLLFRRAQNYYRHFYTLLNSHMSIISFSSTSSVRTKSPWFLHSCCISSWKMSWNQERTALIKALFIWAFSSLKKTHLTGWNPSTLPF